MSQVKDLWFRTDLYLEEIASRLGMKNFDFDSENYWEWVIGDYHGIRLDLTRCHLIEPLETETRIFRIDGSVFDSEVVDSIVVKILNISASGISIGRWDYLDGNDYNFIEYRKIT